MYEKFPKKGHKSFGGEKSASFVPGQRGPEYQQVGSGTSYPGKSSNTSASNWKVKKRSGSFAKAGGNAQVSASYPKKLHQNSFGTQSGHSLDTPPTKTAKQA